MAKRRIKKQKKEKICEQKSLIDQAIIGKIIERKAKIRKESDSFLEKKKCTSIIHD